MREDENAVVGIGHDLDQMADEAIETRSGRRRVDVGDADEEMAEELRDRRVALEMLAHAHERGEPAHPLRRVGPGDPPRRSVGQFERRQRETAVGTVGIEFDPGRGPADRIRVGTQGLHAA